MLSESKFSKYLLYAIGEIILVVIGILIAVQINITVNEKRLHSENEILLKKMLSELELNKARMLRLAHGDSLSFNRDRYVSLEKAVLNSQTLLDRTYEGLEASDLSFILNESLGAGGSYLNLHNSIYEELLNTGKLYTLGSDELVTAIKEYYKRCEREDLYNKGNSKNMDDGFQSIEKSISMMRLDYRQDSADFNLDDYPWFFDQNSAAYKELQLGLDKIIYAQELNGRKMDEIRAYSDTLAIVIKAELATNY